MYDFLGNLVGKISFSTVEDYTSPVIELYDMAPTGVIGGKTTIMPGSVSLESLYFGDKYSVHISPYIGIQFRKMMLQLKHMVIVN